jgi:hypothetical protein
MGHAIDGVLPSDVEQPFRHHLELCARCKREHDLEVLAKQLVRGRLRRVVTPPHITQGILHAIRQETRAEQGLLDRFLQSRVLAPALAVGIAAVVMLLMFTPRQPDNGAARHTASNDIINQTITNFALIRSGEMKPTVVSCYPEGVVGFFERNNVRFAVHVKSIEECDWYGAISSEYAGVTLAHVMYRIGDEILYVYQVDQREVGTNAALGLPPAAKAALAETGWYTDPSHPDCNVVLWTTESGTLCVAVSTMKKDRLLAFLTSR